MKNFKKLLLLAPLLIGTPVFAQTTARLVIAFANQRSFDATHNQVDITVASGTGYVTNNAIYDGSTNPGNSNGSWEGINFRFTQTGSWQPSELSVVYPTPGFIGAPVPVNTTAGGCYPLEAAFNIAIDRVSPGPDANAVPIVVATLITPKNPNTLTIRNTTLASCSLRETFWTNSNVTNTGARLGVQGNAVPLAVKLTSFDAIKATGNAVAINWTAATEQGADRYEVQRATDGKTFDVTVAKVKANGAGNYKELDLYPVKGVNYYRLKIISTTGDFNYSSVKTVSFSNDHAFSLSPNPTSATVTIQGTNASDVINIVANTGQLLSTTLCTGNAQQVNVSNLVPGMYFVQVMQGNEVRYNARFVKQ